MAKCKTLKEINQDKRDHKKRYNRSIVQAMTDEELYQIRDMVEEEVRLREADDLTISDSSNPMKED